MNPVTRRIFLKPAGITADQSKRFGELLSAALIRQQKLAEQTPYILSPSGGLTETELAFEFEHEPASGLSIPELFDPQSPPLSVEQLSQACSGLVYALRVAHASGPFVHGGICPGTLVQDPSGLWKLTDFGFAPAVLAVLESDAFINLAVGRSAAHPDASAVWQILTDPEEPRDERLWSFVDPNRYAQALKAAQKQPARFDPISDVISAGFVLYILADRIHPYLKSIDAAEEFRIASYWTLLPTGRPRDIARKDLTADPQSDLYDWWKNFVPKAIERKPENRKTIEELAVRLEQFAPPFDATKLLEGRRNAEAQRWFATLESRVAAADWAGADALLAMPPGFAPPDSQARVAAAREAVSAHKKAIADAERERAELADWTAWLDSIQTQVDSSDWDAAADLLKQRRDRGLTACPESLRGRWQALTATVRTAREERDRGLELAARAEHAQTWIAQMRAAAESSDAAQAMALGAVVPDTNGCEAALSEEVESLAKWAAEVRAAVEADHATAQAWLAQAEAEAARRRWREALNLLDQPPDISHLPNDFEARVTRLRTAWTQRLASLGDERRAAAEALVHGLVAECAKRRLAEFVQPDAIDTIVKSIRDDETGGKPQTLVEFAVGWGHAHDQDAGPLGQFNCTIGFEGTEPRLLSDAAELTGAIATALTGGIAVRQREALTRWTQSLKVTFLGGTDAAPEIQTPVAKIAAPLKWARGEIEAKATVALAWDARSMTWRPAKDAASLADLGKQAAGIAMKAIEQALFEKLPALVQWRTFIAIAPPKLPLMTWEKLPPTLQFNIPVVMRPPGGQAEPLVTAQVAMPSPVDANVKFDARVLKTAVEAILLKQRKTSVTALGGEIQSRLKKSAITIKSSPDPRTSIESAAWTLTAKGVDPIDLAAKWKDDALAFAFPTDWPQTIDEYVNRAAAASVKEPPPETTPVKNEKPAGSVAKPAKPASAPPPAPTSAPAAAPSARESPTPAIATPADQTPPAPRNRRAQLGIAGGVAVAIVGSAIAWFATRPKPPGPAPDPRIAEVTSWFDSWTRTPDASRTDDWYARLESAVTNELPAPPGGMPDYDTRLAELRSIVEKHRTAKPIDPLAAWRGMIDEANRLLTLNQFDEAQAVLGEQMRKEQVPAELRDAVTNLESAIAAARNRATPPATTDPTTPPSRPAWPEGWESGLTLPRMVRELAGDLWQDAYAAAVPALQVRPQTDMVVLPDDEIRIALADTKLGLPALTGHIERSGNVPTAVGLNEASQRALIAWLADRTLGQLIEKPLAAGELNAVYNWKARLTADKLFASALLDATQQTRIQSLVATIPPAWQADAKFTAGPADPRCGYPTTLTEVGGGQRAFKLIWTHAGDAAYWSLADAAIKAAGGAGRRDLETVLIEGSNPVEKPIRLMYIETGVSNTAPPPANMPTVSEWFLAAAKDAAIRSGPKTWCQSGWACGSAELTLSGNRAVRIPELPVSESAIATWTVNPLTCQQRDPTEILDPPIAGYRSVLRFWPAP